MMLKLAWRNIWRNKRRTLITAASIVFAVLLAVVMNSMKEGVLYKLQENVVSFYSGAVQIHKKGYWEEKTLDNSFVNSDSLISWLEQQKEVSGVVPRIESFALSASDKYSKGCMVVGIQPEKESMITGIAEKVEKGTYLVENDEGALLSTGLAAYLKLDVGDTLVIIGQGYHGVSAAGKFPVKGLIKFASPELNKSTVYLSLKQAQWLFGAEDRSTALVLELEDVSNAEKVATSLEELINNEKYEIMDWKTLMPELNQVLEGERAESAIFLFVLYLLISFGIFGTVLMMTMERQYEFGVLIAIGMRKLKLSTVVILENFIISIIGSIIGTLLSMPVVVYYYFYPIEFGGELAEAYENFGFEPVFYFSVAPQIFYSQTLIVLAIALVTAVYPLFKINRLKAVNAMRK